MDIRTFSKREKNIVILGGIFLVLFCAVQFIYLPKLQKRNELKNIIKVETDSLKQIQALQKQYQKVSKKDVQTIIFNKKNKELTLFSFLNVQAQKSGVKDNVVYMQPSLKEIDDKTHMLSKVRIKLSNTYLKELINFLSRVEMLENGVRISSLSLSKSGKNKDMINAVIGTEVLTLKGDS